MSPSYQVQAIEDLYLVLLTNKQSNILQDIESLQLFSRAIADTCKNVDEKEVGKHAFELLSVFDEIIALGYSESVTVSQIKKILEMESQEERIQAEIAKNKEKEAKDELNRKMRALELQKKEMAKKGLNMYSNPTPSYSSSSYSKPQSSYGSYDSQPKSSFSSSSTSDYNRPVSKYVFIFGSRITYSNQCTSGEKRNAAWQQEAESSRDLEKRRASCSRTNAIPKRS